MMMMMVVGGPRKINIVIPVNGEGQRFADAAGCYCAPKPLVRVLGREMLLWLLHSLDLSRVDTVVMPYAAHLDAHGFPDIVRAFFRGREKTRVRLVPLHFNTRGAIETLSVALTAVMSDEATEFDAALPVLCLDCDVYYPGVNITQSFADFADYFADFADFADAVDPGESNETPGQARGGGAVFVAEEADALAQPPPFSYVRTTADGSSTITDIVEKVRVSSLACCGAYGFWSAAELAAACRAVMREASCMQHSEFFVSSLIRHHIAARGARYVAKVIEGDAFRCLGTPQQVQQHLARSPQCAAEVSRAARTVRLDLRAAPAGCARVRLDEGRRRLLEALRAAGHRVVIVVGPSEDPPDTDLADLADEIEVAAGPPPICIGHDCVPLGADWSSALGWPLDPRPASTSVRRHHALESSASTVTKRAAPEAGGEEVGQSVTQSVTQSILNQARYYRQLLPAGPQIRALFPRLLHADSSSLTLERIHGPTLSTLYVQRLLTPRQLSDVLDGLSAIHRSDSDSDARADNLYSNYLPKLRARAGRDPETSRIFAQLVDRDLLDRVEGLLAEYQSSGRAVPAARIHGDPVFTNIIWSASSGRPVFIDVRASRFDPDTQREAYAEGGDAMYDYAKLYQSIAGYDEILHNTQVASAYRERMAAALFCHVEALHGPAYVRSVQHLAALLLLSLLPLHDAPLRPAFVRLARHIVDESTR